MKILLPLLALTLNVQAACISTPVETDFSYADMNGDGVVNLADFSLFRSVWGSSGELGDFNGDFQVNLEDYVLFRRAFGAHEVVVTTHCN